MEKVSFLLVTHSEVNSFKNCLQEIIWHSTRQNEYDWEVLVLLNGVEKEVRGKYFELKKFFEKKYQNIKFFENPKNINFSKANNFLAKHSSGDYLVLINDDVILVNKINAIKEMLKCFSKHENVGVVGARLLFPNGKIQHAGVVFKGGQPVHYCFGENDLHPCAMKEREFQAVTFALAMIKKEVWDKLNGLYEPEEDEFAYYYEDVDFCLRARELGYSVWYCPDAVALHYGSLTTRKIFKTQSDVFKYLDSFKQKNVGKYVDDYKDIEIPPDAPKILVAIPLSEQVYWLKDFLLHNLARLYFCRDLLYVFFIVNNSGVRFINELKEWEMLYAKMLGLKVIFPNMILFENDKNKVIVETRNMAIEKAKEIKATHIFFWDADVYLPYDTLLKLVKINTEEYPITSGLVPYKDDFGRYMVFRIRDDVKDLNEFEKKLKHMSDLEAEDYCSDWEVRNLNLGCYRDAKLENEIEVVDATGNGCLLIRTDVASKAKYEPATNGIAKYFGTEDLFWFFKLNKLGYKVKVDTTIRCNHLDLGRVF